MYPTRVIYTIYLHVYKEKGQEETIKRRQVTARDGDVALLAHAFLHYAACTSSFCCTHTTQFRDRVILSKRTLHRRTYP